jgi:hypothetical protein
MFGYLKALESSRRKKWSNSKMRMLFVQLRIAEKTCSAPFLLSLLTWLHSQAKKPGWYARSIADAVYSLLPVKSNGCIAGAGTFPARLVERRSLRSAGAW